MNYIAIFTAIFCVIVSLVIIYRDYQYASENQNVKISGWATLTQWQSKLLFLKRKASYISKFCVLYQLIITLPYEILTFVFVMLCMNFLLKLVPVADLSIKNIMIFWLFSGTYNILGFLLFDLYRSIRTKTRR